MDPIGSWWWPERCPCPWGAWVHKRRLHRYHFQWWKLHRGWTPSPAWPPPRSPVSVCWIFFKSFTTDYQMLVIHRPCRRWPWGSPPLRGWLLSLDHIECISDLHDWRRGHHPKLKPQLGPFSDLIGLSNSYRNNLWMCPMLTVDGAERCILLRNHSIYLKS